MQPDSAERPLNGLLFGNRERVGENHVTLHKRPSIKSQEILRITDDLLASSKQHLSGVTETKTCLQTSVPHLPKISCAVVQENAVKGSEMPFSSIVDFFMERKRTVKWNGFQWQRSNISVPSNLPLVIRGYRSRNSINMEDNEECIGNRKVRRCCIFESSSIRKILQNSAEQSTYTNPNCLGDNDERDNSSLQQYHGPLSIKYQMVGTKLAGKFQVKHGLKVDDDDDIKSVKTVNSPSDSVASVKWSKGFVRKPVNNQLRPSATYFSEAGNTRLCKSDLNVNGTSCPKYTLVPSVRKLKSITSKRCDQPVTDSSCRTELEQICSLSYLNGINQDMDIEHRSVSQVAHCTADTGSDQFCFDDNCAGNVEQVSGEKGAGPDHAPEAVTKITFQSPVVQDIFPVTPNCEKPAGKMNKITKQPGRKLQQTQSNSSIVTSLSKTSVKSYTSKISERTVCDSTISKCSDKESKISSTVSGDDTVEECIFDLNQILHEGGERFTADIGIVLPMVKCGARCHNRKQPMKSSLKKSFDWRNHSQMVIVEAPKTREEWKDDRVKKTLVRNMKGCLQNKHLIPLYQSLNQNMQDYVCSIPEESTEFCTNCYYGQKQDWKFRQPCHQPSQQHNHQNLHNLGLLNTMQQRLEQLYYYGTTEQKSTMNIKMAVNTNASSNHSYCRENYTAQAEGEQNCLRLPQSLDLIWCKTPSPERTVELSSSRGGKVPKITMTCPTPISCRTPL
uniref:uncharacterized protein n=1 Tax=Pristiophorus japonicus TaxID=55135 RepID=UPI00398F6F21